MAKFIELSIGGHGKPEKVLINVDQIVSVEKFDNMYRIRTTAIQPVAHGTGSIVYDIRDEEFEKKLLEKES